MIYESHRQLTLWGARTDVRVVSHSPRASFAHH